MSELSELRQELRGMRQDMSDFLTEMRTANAAREQVCEAAARQRATHQNTLYGNGKPGICSRLQRIEDRFMLLWLSLGCIATLLATVLIEALARHFGG